MVRSVVETMDWGYNKFLELMGILLLWPLIWAIGCIVSIGFFLLLPILIFDHPHR